MTNKNKKCAKKAREQLLKEQRAAVVEALRTEKVSSPVSFVLEPERKTYDPSLPGMGLLSPETLEALANYGKLKAPVASPSSPAGALEAEDARVVVDGRTSDMWSSGHAGDSGHGHKDQYKIPWPKLKIHMLQTRTDRTAAECARLVFLSTPLFCYRSPHLPGDRLFPPSLSFSLWILAHCSFVYFLFRVGACNGKSGGQPIE